MNKFFVPKDIYLPRYNRNCSTYLKNKEIKYTKMQCKNKILEITKPTKTLKNIHNKT